MLKTITMLAVMASATQSAQAEGYNAERAPKPVRDIAVTAPKPVRDIAFAGFRAPKPVRDITSFRAPKPVRD